MNVKALAVKTIPGIFDDDATTFVVLDGASVPELLEQMHRLRPEYECLYRGELKPDMAEVAPYLVKLVPGSEFAKWICENGWGKHWGIFVNTHADLRELHRHLRTLLIVHDSDGKPLYFRFYDPRVLRVFLPTCNAGELKQLFGPVDSFVSEAENPETATIFRSAGDSLRQDSAKVGE